MDILFLVDRLENLIADSRRIPLINQILIREADILNIVKDMRMFLPEEIKQARGIIHDKERTIAQAQADASTLLARAREESERALSREGLLRAAKERSQEIVRNAEVQAEQLKTEADAYVVETLRALRDHLSSIEMDVGHSILSIEKGLASLELPPDEDSDEDEGVEEKYDEDDVGEVQEQISQPPSRPVPRRASLAADTMGGPTYSQDAGSWGNE